MAEAEKAVGLKWRGEGRAEDEENKAAEMGYQKKRVPQKKRKHQRWRVHQ